jgi:hypothetical protein
MTKPQRDLFFGRLWPKACRVQAWTGELNCEVKRREVVLKATTEWHDEVPKSPVGTDRMSECNQDQLTAVFNYVKWLADPANLGKARTVANPVQAKIDNDCRQVIFCINQLGFTTAYIQRIAAWDCREAQVADWTGLPKESLQRVLIHLTTRRNQKQHRTEPDQVIDYQMKPRKIFSAAVSNNNPF